MCLLAVGAVLLASPGRADLISLESITFEEVAPLSEDEAGAHEEKAGTHEEEEEPCGTFRRARQAA